MSWCFVVGTDTGVGKTAVSVALLEGARSIGTQTLGIKPFETGCVASENRMVGLDARALAGASTERDDDDGFFRLERQASPRAAARSAGITIDRAALVVAIRGRLTSPVGLGIVEGAGGLLVPMGDDWGLVDLLGDLALPVLVVARSGLGTVNHTLLTLEALQRRDLRVLGFVLNDSDRPIEAWFAEENGEEVQRLSGVPYVGHSQRGELGRAKLPVVLSARLMAMLSA